MLMIYLGDAILSSNLNVPLKGLAIGNGWIDARRQYAAYLDYAVKHDLIEESSDVSYCSSSALVLSDIVLGLQTD